MIRWRTMEPGRVVEVVPGNGARLQLVWRGSRWVLQRVSWEVGKALYVSPVTVGRFDTLFEGKAHADKMRRATQGEA